MGKLSKGGLVLGGLGVGLLALRKMLNPAPRYAASAKPRYQDFEKRVLVVGGGFGGYTAAMKLCNLVRNREDMGVLMVSKENFFTFWPMVPGIIASEADTRNVAQPLRRSLIQAGASFRRAKITKVDPEKKVVVSSKGIEFPYDQLILSVGGQPNYFGIPGVEEHAFSVKSVQDAEHIRDQVIERFEEVSLIRGEVPDSKLTFVVIGAGATGVEVAAELNILVHEVLAHDYPNINPHQVKVSVLEGSSTILGELEPALRRAARNRLASERIEVRLNTLAQEVTADRVRLHGGDEILTENVIWTAGARPNAVIQELGLPYDERTGIKVDEYLRVEGHDDIWAIGDGASIRHLGEPENGKTVPPTAQAAMHEGYVVARNVLATFDGKEDRLKKFVYKPIGQMVEMGSDFAANEVLGINFSGLPAALFWRIGYLVRLRSPQSRARIAADWIIGYFMRPAVTQVRGSEE
ncbi:MAG: NAD(P)/FAD-dependent oxidoreductase [Rubrobacteraceae bacterium]